MMIQAYDDNDVKVWINSDFIELIQDDTKNGIYVVMKNKTYRLQDDYIFDDIIDLFNKQ